VGFLETIKNLFQRGKNNLPELSSTNIVRYDTSLVHIREYKKLSKDEQAKVDEFIEKTKIDKLEDVVFYGEGISKHSTAITELLLSTLFQITDEMPIGKLETRPKEDILTEKINTLIAKAQMSHYQNALFDLQKEAELRTIALQEINKKNNRIFRRIFGAPNVEKIKKQFEKRMFEDAIERMKISAKVIEQQIQAVMNNQSNMRYISTSFG